MSKTFKFKGGPLDGVQRVVPYDRNTRSYPDIYYVPHPGDVVTMTELSWGVGDETPPASTVTIRNVAYHLTKVSDGHGNITREYWTDGERANDLARQRQQRSLAERVAELEQQVMVMTGKLLELGDGVTAVSVALKELSDRYDVLIEALNATSTVPSLATEYESRLP